MNRPLIALVGPTATGKTELSLRLAEVVGGEVVNADSRQVYRYMDIGTAKPTPEEQSRAPHHLFDVVDPDEDFSLALYQEMAARVVSDIRGRERIPLLTGGSGQYIWAVVEGWSIPPVAPDEGLRRELESRAQDEGIGVLFEELLSMDPGAADIVDPRNARRVIRALEVCRVSGRPFSELRRKHPPDFEVRMVGLTLERETLYRRIDERVDRMVAGGFVEEVRGLLDRGFSQDLPAMSSLGYREIGSYLAGEQGLEEAIQQIKYNTHRFARRQYSWFRLKDRRIRWLDIGAHSPDAMVKLALADTE